MEITIKTDIEKTPSGMFYGELQTLIPGADDDLIQRIQTAQVRSEKKAKTLLRQIVNRQLDGIMGK